MPKPAVSSRPGINRQCPETRRLCSRLSASIGYSGFARRIPAWLNVDRAFVQMLTDLARRIEIKTIAEWFQDEDLQRISPCCAASGERALTLPF